MYKYNKGPTKKGEDRPTGVMILLREINNNIIVTIVSSSGV